jgi:hypothetical protein
MGEPAKGSTKDYCSAWPGDPHAMVSHVGGDGPVRSVERCMACNWIDFEALNDQYRAEFYPALDMATVLGLLRGVRTHFGDDVAIRPEAGRLTVIAEVAHGKGWVAGYIDIATATFHTIPAVPDTRPHDDA